MAEVSPCQVKRGNGDDVWKLRKWIYAVYQQYVGINGMATS